MVLRRAGYGVPRISFLAALSWLFAGNFLPLRPTLDRMSGRQYVRWLDWPLVLLYLGLVLMGWLNIYAAVYSEEHASIFDLTQRYGQQLLWIVAAVLIGIFTLLVDSRFYYVFTYIIYTLMLLVLLVVLGVGTEIHGSRSWLVIGTLRVQPAEFAKVATAMALAKYLGGFSFRPDSLRSWLGAFALLGLPVGMILLQNDVGSAMVYSAFLLVFYRQGFPGGLLLFGCFLVVVFVAALLVDQTYIVLGLGLSALVLYGVASQDLRGTFRLGGLAGGGVALLFFANEWFALGLPLYWVCLAPLLAICGVAAVVGVWMRRRIAWLVPLMFVVCVGASYSVDYVFDHVLEAHHQRRINDLLGKEDDPLGWGYNVNQSKIAIGSGGFLGKGYLQGTQTKYNFVPEQSTDFIFCTVGEEWGFVGSLVVVGLFLLLLLRVLTVAERQREPYHRVYGYGVAAILFFHFAVNISMTIGLFPVVGIPLPFFSYGGSSLWAFTILLFILLRFDMGRKR